MAAEDRARYAAETMLVSAVVRTGDLLGATMAGVTPAMVTSCEEQWQWITEWHERHDAPPEKAMFRRRFPDFPLVSTDMVGVYANEVVREATKSKVLLALEDVADAIVDDDVETALTTMQRRATDVGKAFFSTGTESNMFVSWQDTFDEVSDRVARADAMGYSGIPTGFPTFDSITGGWQPGWFGLVAARMGVGKSWLMLRMAVEAIETGRTVQIHTLEMSSTQVALRIHALLARIHGYSFRSDALMRGECVDLDEYKRFLKELDEHYGDEDAGSLIVHDASRGKVTPDVVRASIERNSPDLVLVDYITLMESPGDDWRATARLSNEIKLIATGTGVPIVCAAQINRSGVSRSGEPAGIHTLSQSDQLGMDADLALSIGKRSPGVLKAKCVKNRHGLAGFSFHVDFRPSEGVMDEISESRALDLIDEQLDAEDDADTE